MQVTAVHVLPRTVLDLGELQLKLQLEPGTGRVCLPEGFVLGARSAADLARELQAEHAVDEQERLELRTRRDVLTEFHVAQQVQGRDGVEVIITGTRRLLLTRVE